MMYTKMIRLTGLGLLLLTVASLVVNTPALADPKAPSAQMEAHSAPALPLPPEADTAIQPSAPAAQPVAIDLCATTGTATMPDSTVVPIWSYVPGDCTGTSGTATLPGTQITASAGDTVIITLYNDLSVPTSLIVPGQLVSASGGTAGTFTNEAPPGGSATYTINMAAVGTYLYQSGTNASIQVAMGLHGALVVDSGVAGQAYGPGTNFDTEAILVLSEIDPDLNNNPGGFEFIETVFDPLSVGDDRVGNYRPVYWLINGLAYPDTLPSGPAPGRIYCCAI